MMNKYKTFEELKEELGDKFEEYMYKANIELLNKIENAIDFIKYNSGMISKWTNIKSRYAQEELSTDQLDDLLEILGDVDDE